MSEAAFSAWPWTINVEGTGYTFNTKQQAIDAVSSFRTQGARMAARILPSGGGRIAAAFGPTGHGLAAYRANPTRLATRLVLPRS